MRILLYLVCVLDPIAAGWFTYRHAYAWAVFTGLSMFAILGYEIARKIK